MRTGTLVVEEGVDARRRASMRPARCGPELPRVRQSDLDLYIKLQ